MRIYHYGEETVYVFKAAMNDGTNCLLVVESRHEIGTVDCRILFNCEIDQLDDDDLYGSQYDWSDWETDWEELEHLLVLEDFDGDLDHPDRYSQFMDRYVW